VFSERKAERHTVPRGQTADRDVERVVCRQGDDAPDELSCVESATATIADVVAFASEIRLELALLCRGWSGDQHQQQDCNWTHEMSLSGRPTR
jgi:hypothetical protein